LTAGVEICDLIRSDPVQVEAQNSLPFKSVDTPVANKPLEATASEPPRSTVMISDGKEIQLSSDFTHARNCSAMDNIETILNPNE
jgi:hypothetical protein